MSKKPLQRKDRYSERALWATLVLLAVLLLSGIILQLSPQAHASETQGLVKGEHASDKTSDDTDSSEYEVYTFTNKDLVDAQTNQSDTGSGVIIPETYVPLTSFSESSQSYDGSGGSFFNTALVVASIALILVIVLLLLRSKTNNYKIIALRTAAVTLGLVTVTTWSLLDRMQAPTSIFNSSSTLITLIFILFITVMILSYLFEARCHKVKTK